MKYRWLFHHKTFYFVPHCIHVYSSNKTFKNLVECQSCPEGFYSVMNMCSCCKFQHRAYKSYSSRLMNVLILVATERKVVSANPRCLEDTGIGGVGKIAKIPVLRIQSWSRLSGQYLFSPLFSKKLICASSPFSSRTSPTHHVLPYTTATKSPVWTSRFWRSAVHMNKNRK